MKFQIDNAVDTNVSLIQLMLIQLCQYLKELETVRHSNSQRNTAIGYLIEIEPDISQISDLIKTTITLHRSTYSWISRSDDPEAVRG